MSCSQASEPAIKRQKLASTEINELNNNQFDDQEASSSTKIINSTTSDIPHLPTEVLIQIFKRVDPSALPILSQCSRNFRQIALIFNKQWPKTNISLYLNISKSDEGLWASATTSEGQMNARQLKDSKLCNNFVVDLL